MVDSTPLFTRSVSVPASSVTAGVDAAPVIPVARYAWTEKADAVQPCGTGIVDEAGSVPA